MTNSTPISPKQVNDATRAIVAAILAASAFGKLGTTNPADAVDTYKTVFKLLGDQKMT